MAAPIILAILQAWIMSVGLNVGCMDPKEIFRIQWAEVMLPPFLEYHHG